MIESHRLTGIADEGAGTITEQIALHQSFGWKSIELRTVGGENVCEMDDTSFNALAAALEEADFTVVALTHKISVPEVFRSKIEMHISSTKANLQEMSLHDIIGSVWVNILVLLNEALGIVLGVVITAVGKSGA